MYGRTRLQTHKQPTAGQVHDQLLNVFIPTDIQDPRPHKLLILFIHDTDKGIANNQAKPIFDRGKHAGSEEPRTTVI